MGSSGTESWVTLPFLAAVCLRDADGFEVDERGEGFLDFISQLAIDFTKRLSRTQAILGPVEKLLCEALDNGGKDPIHRQFFAAIEMTLGTFCVPVYATRSTI